MPVWDRHLHMNLRNIQALISMGVMCFQGAGPDLHWLSVNHLHNLENDNISKSCLIARKALEGNWEEGK